MYPYKSWQIEIQTRGGFNVSLSLLIDIKTNNWLACTWISSQIIYHVLARINYSYTFFDNDYTHEKVAYLSTCLLISAEIIVVTAYCLSVPCPVSVSWILFFHLTPSIESCKTEYFLAPVPSYLVKEGRRREGTNWKKLAKYKGGRQEKISQTIITIYYLLSGIY